MDNSNRKILPVRDGLWTVPQSMGEKPQLIANKCGVCGEILFPRKQLCPNCHHKDLQDIRLSRVGKIYSVTVVMQRPAIYYQGPVPYAFGYVELPEGVRVKALFTGCDPNMLEIGMYVELVIEKLCKNDEGHEVLAYKFAPIKQVRES